MFRQGREMHEEQGENSAAITDEKGNAVGSQITYNAANQKNKLLTASVSNSTDFSL
jgi:hypothetical protein